MRGYQLISPALRRFLRRPASSALAGNCNPAQAGHSLLEVMVVLSLLAVCLAVGGILLSRGLSSVEARGAAQAWQAAATWAQTGAVWLGDAGDVELGSGHLAVSTGVEAGAGDLGASVPAVCAVPNVVRWQRGEGVVVRFLGGSAYPNAAGSLYFKAPGGDYRVTVRLESGLTVRTRTDTSP